MISYKVNLKYSTVPLKKAKKIHFSILLNLIFKGSPITVV